MSSVPSSASSGRTQRRIASRLAPNALARTLRDALTGTAHAGVPQVIWEDRGSQILLHVDTLQVRMLDRVLAIAVDVETVESGRTALIVRFVFGTATGPAGLVASTDETVHGDPIVAARWGSLFRGVMWSAIVRLSETHATERGRQAQSIAMRKGHLELAASAPVSLATLAAAHLARNASPRRAK